MSKLNNYTLYTLTVFFICLILNSLCEDLAAAEPESPTTLRIVGVDPPKALASEGLSPDGHPRISWQQSAASGMTYKIERRWDRKEEMPCASEQVDPQGWCRVNSPTVEPAASHDRRLFTDTEVRADRATAVEYQYRVTAEVDGESSPAHTVWANCCDNDIDGHGAMERWIEQLNRHPLILSDGRRHMFSLSDLPDPTPYPTYTQFAEGEFAWLSDDRYIALFSMHGGLLALTHRSQGEEFIHGERKHSAAGWQIRLNNSQGSGLVKLQGNHHTPDKIFFDRSTGTLHYDWYDVDGLRVECSWRLVSIHRTGLHARISVTGTADSVKYGASGIERIHFPSIVGLGYEYVDLYWPGYNIGIWESDFPRWSGEPHRLLSTLTSSQTAQFVGLGHGRQMMYVAAEDGRAEPKTFRIQPHVEKISTRPDGEEIIEHYNTSATELYLYPQNGDSRPGNSVEMTYDVVLTPFCGGWPRLAKRYRRFAIEQAWLDLPETSVKAAGDARTLVKARTQERIDLPSALKEGVFWWTSCNSSEDPLYKMEHYMNQILKPAIGPAHSVPVGMHLYNWHSPEFDRNYPQFEPRFYCGTDRAQENACAVTMPDLVQSVQSDGTLVMPYINATKAIITDRCYFDHGPDIRCKASPDAPDGLSWGWWTRPFFSDSTKPEVPDNIIMRKTPVRLENGVEIWSYDSWYNSKETFAEMDLTSDFWQRVITHNTTSVYGFGALGIYLDCLGGGYHPDYAPQRGLPRDHPAGHSDYWLRGTRRIASITQTAGDIAERDQAQGQTGPRFNSAEHFNEAYIGSIDLFTVYSQQPNHMIPLIPAVYSDFQIFAGPQLRNDDSPDARSYRLAKGFLWGLQLGLTSLRQLQGSNEVECEDAFIAGGSQRCDYPNLEFARSLAKARRALKQFLAYGELLELPADPDLAKEKQIDAWCIDQDCQHPESVRFPNILAARWRRLSGQEIMVIVNPNDSEESANLPLPYSWMGRRVTCFAADGSAVQCGDVGPEGNYFRATLTHKTVRYLAVSQLTPE